MKWPSSITLVRHGESQYNALRALKDQDARYLLFRKAFDKDPESPICRELAAEMQAKFALNVSDYATRLTEIGLGQAGLTGNRMLENGFPVPDVVIISPYLRTRDTFRMMSLGWPELATKPKIYFDDRIREQEHGLSLIYNDWRIFQTFHPEQRKLHQLRGPYWYTYPQGESVAEVRDRVRSITNTIIREWVGCNVMLITHHLAILSVRANFERLTPEEFIRLDEEEKPKNCGVTIYKGNPKLGSNGKLELDLYNHCFWDVKA